MDETPPRRSKKILKKNWTQETKVPLTYKSSSQDHKVLKGEQIKIPLHKKNQNHLAMSCNFPRRIKNYNRMITNIKEPLLIDSKFSFRGSSQQKVPSNKETKSHLHNSKSMLYSNLEYSSSNFNPREGPMSHIKQIEIDFKEKDLKIKELEREFNNLLSDYERLLAQNESLVKLKNSMSKKIKDQREKIQELVLANKKFEMNFQKQDSTLGYNDEYDMNMSTRNLRTRLNRYLKSPKGSNKSSSLGKREKTISTRIGNQTSNTFFKRSLERKYHDRPPNDDQELVFYIKSKLNTSTILSTVQEFKKLVKRDSKNRKFVEAVRKLAMQLTAKKLQKKVRDSDKQLWKWLKGFFEDYMEIKSKSNFKEKIVRNLEFSFKEDDAFLLKGIDEVLGRRGKKRVIEKLKGMKGEVSGLVKIFERVKEIFLIDQDQGIDNVLDVLDGVAENSQDGVPIGVK